MKNPNFLVVILIMTTAIGASFVWPVSCFAQQPSSSTSTTVTTTNRIIYLFNSHVPSANETKLGIPTDLFAPSSITVNKGDKQSSIAQVNGFAISVTGLIVLICGIIIHFIKNV